MHHINVRGQLIPLNNPVVMGIVNITPDSFYAASRIDADNVVQTVGQMLIDGAQIIDMGGQSTRPGAKAVSEEDEMIRVIPAIKKVVSAYPDAIISVDTFYSQVARKGIEAGAAMVNDVSAGSYDARMFETVASLKVPYVLMHSKGTALTMNSLAQYKDMLAEIIFFLSEKILELRRIGVADIIIDPGFGFAKNEDQNLELLNRLDELNILECPVLCGLSRKRFVQRLGNTDANNALKPSLDAAREALSRGAGILRVHDVKETVALIQSMNRQLAMN